MAIQRNAVTFSGQDHIWSVMNVNGRLIGTHALGVNRRVLAWTKRVTVGVCLVMYGDGAPPGKHLKPSGVIPSEDSRCLGNTSCRCCYVTLWRKML